MNYIVKINEFSGPLDLLLHLIKISDVNIYDISIEEITEQYLEYIKKMEKLDIEIASEYLIMASELLLIKSSSLLPNNNNITEEENEEEITRENLINRLVEYQKYKELTKNFKTLEKERHDIYTKSPSKLNNITKTKFTNDNNVSVNELLDAFSKFLERKNLEKPLNTKITNKEYSVKKRKRTIKDYLQKEGKTEFKKLFNTYNKSYIIVTFLSILELAKENQINVTQNRNFSNIYIELNN